MKSKMNSMLGLVAVLTCQIAVAGSVTCSGTVEAISYHSNDTFMVRLSSMNLPVFFCSPESTFTVPGTSYTTGPQTCKAFIALFVAARESGKTIVNLYFDGDAVPATCNGWVPWSSANIRHFSY